MKTNKKEGDKEKAREQLREWLTERLRFGDAPRVTDVQEWVKEQKLPLKKTEIGNIMRLHNAYMFNMPQQLMPKRARMYRPIIINDLGYWHADIGYFAKNKMYEMPETYRHGFLVAKDVLSRRIYATPLLRSKDAKAVINAFQVLFDEHNRHLPNVPVKGVSFDRETAVMGKEVQAFLKKKNIKFHDFQMSSSKAKCAEGGIRQIRSIVARLMKRKMEKDRWYTLLEVATKILNNQTVIIDGKKLHMTPEGVNEVNLKKFSNRLHKAAPAYFWAQFDIAEELLDFKYQVGTKVRAKLLATSSATIGNKTSEMNLTKELFVIIKRVPYVTRNMKPGKAYRCRNLKTRRTEVFQEDEITPGREEDSGGEETYIPPPDYKRYTRSQARTTVKKNGYDHKHTVSY